MSLYSLNLDDRRFEELLETARRRIAQTSPEWNSELAPGDPGTALVDIFAHLTEVMLYRVNRLPEKAYIEFLRLLGVKLHPPAAASATLVFTLKAPAAQMVEIPRGTRVAAERGAAGAEPPVFTTAETVRIPPGRTHVEVTAYHCELVEAELLGHGAGQPGLAMHIRQAPVIAPTGDELDLVVGVETDAAELDDSVPARRHNGSSYRIWREVPAFGGAGSGRQVYVADRVTGLVTFAPALRRQGPGGALGEAAEALGEVPPADRAVRAWYRIGGGPAGNVSADLLKILKDPIPGVQLQVTNPAAAEGGRSGESLDNALQRGPQELHSLRRAVTARDFELVALQAPAAVNRAHAYTKAALWTYAQPGTVEVVCVPDVPTEQGAGAAVGAEALHERETESARVRIEEALDARKPLGTLCSVRWSRYKTVQVKARLVVYREEDRNAVRSRVIERLQQTISPLASPPEQSGWRFGQPLSAYHVYRILGAEPGVKDVAPVRLRVNDVPARNVKALATDAYQPGAWYAGAGETVYRSINDGEGWEPVGTFAGESLELICPYPKEVGGASGRPGLLAAATRISENEPGSRVHLSYDCGETWAVAQSTGFRILDMAWTERDGQPRLLLATEVGLFDWLLEEGEIPVQILVEPQNQKLGFYAVAVSIDVLGQRTSVAVAARGRGGVYLSDNGGKPGTFRPIGLKDEKVRRLAVQHSGPQRYLWAGFTAVGDDPGTGCSRLDLSGAPGGAANWMRFSDGWNAGGCESLAFVGATVLAASTRMGVLQLSLDEDRPRWQGPSVSCGLPLRELNRMEKVDFVAAATARKDEDPKSHRILAAGVDGVYRSIDGGKKYTHSSRQEFDDHVTLPSTWLFCSAPHDIEVVTEDESR